MDWALKIAIDLCKVGDETSEFDVATALRKAKADGMREATDVLVNELTAKSDWGAVYYEIVSLGPRANAIEKGE